jgi:hypothetical protein
MFERPIRLISVDSERSVCVEWNQLSLDVFTMG